MREGNKKKVLGVRGGHIIIILIVVVIISIIAMFIVPILSWKPEVHQDIDHYRDYMSFDTTGGSDKWYKFGVDESIWPQDVTDDMSVEDYKMIYYCPWDASYVGYMVVNYSESDYTNEVGRLHDYDSTEHYTYFHVAEKQTKELLAIKSTPNHGVIYAMDGGNNRIIYGELLFCDGMSIDYEKYVPAEYLLDGFDVKSDNGGIVK